MGARLRRKFGRSLRLWGGVDKRELAKGPAAIDAELARLHSELLKPGNRPARAVVKLALLFGEDFVQALVDFREGGADAHGRPARTATDRHWRPGSERS